MKKQELNIDKSPIYKFKANYYNGKLFIFIDDGGVDDTKLEITDKKEIKEIKEFFKNLKI